MLLKTQPRNLEDLIKNMISCRLILIQKVFLPTNFVLTDRILLALPPCIWDMEVAALPFQLISKCISSKTIDCVTLAMKKRQDLSCEVRFLGKSQVLIVAWQDYMIEYHKLLRYHAESLVELCPKYVLYYTVFNLYISETIGAIIISSVNFSNESVSEACNFSPRRIFLTSSYCRRQCILLYSSILGPKKNVLRVLLVFIRRVFAFSFLFFPQICCSAVIKS